METFYFPKDRKRWAYKHLQWYKRYFVRQSTKRGRVFAFSQYYKPQICDDFLLIISEELNVEGIFYDIIEAYLNYKNKHFKVIEKEYEKNFNYYRDDDIEEKEKFIIQKLSKLPRHHSIKQTKIGWITMGFRCC